MFLLIAVLDKTFRKIGALDSYQPNKISVFQTKLHSSNDTFIQTELYTSRACFINSLKVISAESYPLCPYHSTAL